MAPESVLRRLSAILAADVVGYSRLMEIDEAGTLASFNERRHNLVEPTVAKHQGRIVKVMGDGFLITFSSVVEAVQCAIDLQTGLGLSNAELPNAQKIQLRIGINLGDVIVEDDDIFGDGVNVAARLQTMASPGGIVISGTVFDHLKNKIAAGFEFCGEQRVKNIVEPIRIYRVLTDQKDVGKTIGRVGVRLLSLRNLAAGLTILVIAGIGALLLSRELQFEPQLALPDKPSIAVLPFANLSNDPNQDYFADGMTDDLITDLSQISGLFVISSNSAFSYKGKTIDPRQVAAELGVRYLLEGSIQRAGDHVRINAKLIESGSGGHVWANRFDGSMADVFSLQDQVTRNITDALALRLTNEEQRSLDRKETNVTEAYDAYLRGWEHFRRDRPEDYDEAVRYFERAIKLDPDYGRAYASLALVHYWAGTRSWPLGEGNYTAWKLTTINKYLAEAEKHPTSTSHQVAGLVASSLGLYPKAIANFNDAIALDPSDSWSYAYMAYALTFAGRPSEALPYIRTAMRLDPHYPPIYLGFLGFAQFGLEQYEEAADSLEKATKFSPEDSAALLLLGATYGYLGRISEAADVIAAYNALKRERHPITATFAWGTWEYAKRKDRDRLFNGLILAGVPERVKP